MQLFESSFHLILWIKLEIFFNRLVNYLAKLLLITTQKHLKK